MTLFDGNGKAVTLGKRLASRGEGTVSELADGRPLLAKVYHQPTPERAQKLAAMLPLRTERLLKLAAWPVDILRATTGGPPVGFLMPRVLQASEVGELYNPKSRRTCFPDAGWPFLIRAAANTARAFTVLHDHGHVVGDVNQGNLLVTQQATVFLIDCDSFQVKTTGRLFLCPVGVPTHTAPELQGISLSTLARTPNHDAFGLAVLIFQLLFLGRHPFSGGFLGVGEMPMEKAIREFRFAYGDNAKARQMRQPPGTPPLAFASGVIAQLFGRAFCPDGVKGGRPTPREWVTALETLEKSLCACRKNPAHHYLNVLSACPWCDVEARSKVSYFPTPKQPVAPPLPPAADLLALETLWRIIQAVPAPAPPPAFPVAPSTNLVPSPHLRELIAKKKGMLFRLTNHTRLKEALNEAKTRRDGAQTRLAQVQKHWHQDEGYTQFPLAVARLAQRKTEYTQLDTKRQERLRRLQSDVESRQRHRFLDSYSIRSGSIPGIGPSKVAVLQSYGIDTAADVTNSAILAIPGFGPALTGRLMTWRQGLESRFRYDGSKGIDPRDIAAIESEISQLRQQILKELREGPALLLGISQQIIGRRRVIEPVARRILQEIAQAEADIAALS